MDHGAQGLSPADAAQAERLHRFAHDLKNRLGALSASLRMITEVPDGPERDEVLMHAERAYFRALAELENVLDDLGVERGPRTARCENVDLRALVERVADELSFRYERKGQVLRIDLPATHAVLGDPDLLHQAVTTLLSNASKFSGAGTTVRVEALPNGLRVCDQGVGLAPDDLAQVFKPYVMLSSRSTGGEEQGRASLARALRAMRVQGGSLEAASEGPGLGSCFSLVLHA